MPVLLKIHLVSIATESVGMTAVITFDPNLSEALTHVVVINTE